MPVQILAVSDTIDQRIHSASLAERMPDVDLALSCGDLPGRYLEFIVDALNRPLYYVLGNHAAEMQRDEHGRPRGPLGCIDIGGRVVMDERTGLILAGLPGSPRYNNSEPEQYTERQMAFKVARMIPRLLWNKHRHGRALDVLVTHSPPLDLGDRPDVAHRGFKMIRTFLNWFKPAYHLHGHVHLYDRSQSPVMCYDETTIVNVYPYQALEITVPEARPVTPPPGPGPGRAIREQPSASGSATGIFSPLRVEGRGRSGNSPELELVSDHSGGRAAAVARDGLSQASARR